MNRFQNNQFKQLRLQPTQTYSKVINQTIIDFIEVVDATNSLIYACKHLDGFTIQNNLHNEHYEIVHLSLTF